MTDRSNRPAAGRHRRPARESPAGSAGRDPSVRDPSVAAESSLPRILTRARERPVRAADGASVYSKLADPTGFEPAISSVTGWHVGPLHHGSAASRKDSTSPIRTTLALRTTAQSNGQIPPGAALWSPRACGPARDLSIRGLLSTKPCSCSPDPNETGSKEGRIGHVPRVGVTAEPADQGVGHRVILASLD